jgi:hypothetical protein
MSASGDVMVSESQLSELMRRATCLDDLRAKLAHALGAEVDAELEPYRRAGEGTAITWLHEVG